VAHRNDSFILVSAQFLSPRAKSRGLIVKQQIITPSYPSPKIGEGTNLTPGLEGEKEEVFLVKESFE